MCFIWSICLNITCSTTIYTCFTTTQHASISLCISAFQKPECPCRWVSLYFSPALALGWAKAAALTLTRPLLSVLTVLEEFLTPGPKHFHGSWSGPGFSCNVCPREGCGAGRRRGGAGGPDGGVCAESVHASSAAINRDGNCFLVKLLKTAMSNYVKEDFDLIWSNLFKKVANTFRFRNLQWSFYFR